MENHSFSPESAQELLALLKGRDIVVNDFLSWINQQRAEPQPYESRMLPEPGERAVSNQNLQHPPEPCSTVSNTTKLLELQGDLNTTLVASGTQATNCTFQGNQQAGVIYNHHYYGVDQESSVDDPVNFIDKIRIHLCQFYQETAAYIADISGQVDAHKEDWPITKTYRQLALVVSTPKSWQLYAIKNLDESRLPDMMGLSTQAMIVTSLGKAYLVEAGEWLRQGNQGCLVCITGFKGAEQFQWIEHEVLQPVRRGATEITEAIFHQYQASLGHEEQLSRYEAQYQRIERQSIALEQLLSPVVSEQESTAKPQHAVITGRAGIGKSTLLQYIAYCWSWKGQASECVKPLWQDRYDWVLWLPLKWLHRDDCVLANDADKTEYFRLAHFIQKTCGLEALTETEDKQFRTTLANLLREQRARILLLVDSFDEVAHWVQSNCPRGRLIEALFHWSGPMMVTTRPYAQPQLPWSQGKYHWIENVGFLAHEIQAFVQDYFTRYEEATENPGQQLLRVLQRNRNIWNLAHVPLMTRLLCSHWQRASAEERDWAATVGPEVTLTGLIQFFVSGFVERSKARLGENFERRYEYLGILAALAFKTFRVGQSQLLGKALQEQVLRDNVPLPIASPPSLLVPTEHTEEYRAAQMLFKQVLALGLLQPVGPQGDNPFQVHHTFLHLLFQEYLAAWYVVHHLNVPEVRQFIVEHRYIARYQYVLAFSAGLLGLQPERALQQKGFWALLRQEPLSVDGLGDVRIGLACLTETQERADIQGYASKVLEASQEKLDWLVAHHSDQRRIYYQAVVGQLIPIWQQLRIKDGQQLLSRWQPRLERIVEGASEEQDFQEIQRLWQVLRPVGAALLDWLGEAWLKRGLQQLSVSENRWLLRVLAELLGLEATWDCRILKLILQPKCRTLWDEQVVRLISQVVQEASSHNVWADVELKKGLMAWLMDRIEDSSNSFRSYPDRLWKAILAWLKGQGAQVFEDVALKPVLVAMLQSQKFEFSTAGIELVIAANSKVWEDAELKQALISHLTGNAYDSERMRSWRSNMNIHIDTDRDVDIAFMKGLCSSDSSKRHNAWGYLREYIRGEIGEEPADTELKQYLAQALSSEDSEVLDAARGYLRGYEMRLCRDPVLRPAWVEGAAQSTDGYEMKATTFHEFLVNLGLMVWKDYGDEDCILRGLAVDFYILKPEEWQSLKMLGDTIWSNTDWKSGLLGVLKSSTPFTA